MAMTKRQAEAALFQTKRYLDSHNLIPLTTENPDFEKHWENLDKIIELCKKL